jgi:putative ABC transport system permease protein
LGRWGHVRQSIRIENLEFQVIGVLSNKNWQEGKTKILSARNLNKSIFVPIGIEKGFPCKNFVLGNDTLSEIILQLPDSTKTGHRKSEQFF